MCIKTLSPIILLLLLSGCATLQHVPDIGKEYEGNNVTVVRNGNYFGSGLHYWVTVDGVNVAGLLTKQYVELGLSDGSHKIGLRCFGGIVPTWKHKQLDINVSSIRKYYLLSPAATSCGEIEVIEEKEAFVQLKGSTKVSLGSISPCSDGEVKAMCLGF